MNGLFMLIAMIIASVGAAVLILVFSEFIIITLPEMLVTAVNGNNAPSVQARHQSTDQNKAGSCPFC